MEPPPLADWPLWQLALLVAGGFLASGVNAVAGGGSLISFPLLVALGLPPLSANATNAISLWPGFVTGAWGYREAWLRIRPALYRMAVPAFALGGLGAWLLIRGGERLFLGMVPILIGLSVLVVAAHRQVRVMVERQDQRASGPVAGLLFGGVALYGGYFGAGLGVMLLAALGFARRDDLHTLNALKTALSSLITLASTLFFLTQGLIWFIPALAIMTGGILGGYAIARYSVRFEPERVRPWIVAYGVVMTGVFCYQIYF